MMSSSLLYRSSMIPLSMKQSWNGLTVIQKGSFIHGSTTTPSTNMMMNPNPAITTITSSSSSSIQKNNTNHHHNNVVSTKPFFMLILGKPGGGKGTISGKILRDYPIFQHVSTGDILRTHVRQKTDLGLKAKSFMDSGSLVPDDLIIELVMNEASQALLHKKSLLLDGFPRTVTQAISLDHKVHVDLVINLEIPTNTIVERIADRWIHPASGRVYNYSYNPPMVHGKDNQTGEDLIQRDDDKPETVRKRLDAYDKITMPLVHYYENLGVLRTFSGTMSDHIYPDIKKWLDEQLKS